MDMKINVRDSSMIDLNKILYPNLVLKENAIIINSEEIKEKQDTIIMYNMLNNMSNDSKEELFNLYKTIISAESKLIIIDNQQIENIINHNQNNKNYIIKKKLVNKN